MRQDWLSKSSEEVSQLKRSSLREYVEAVIIAGGLEKGSDDDLIDKTVKILHDNGVDGKRVLRRAWTTRSGSSTTRRRQIRKEIPLRKFVRTSANSVF